MPTDSTPAGDNQSLADVMPEAVFRRRVREKREQLGWTQSHLAANLVLMWSGTSLDASAITRLERGERRVRLDEAVALCQILNLDLHEAIAPHPGSLEDQIEHAKVTMDNADYASAFWSREHQAALARLEVLVAQRQEHLDHQIKRERRMRQTIAEHVERGEE